MIVSFGRAPNAWLVVVAAAVLLAVAAPAPAETATASRSEERQRMVATIVAHAAGADLLEGGDTAKAGIDPAVLEVMARVPRHLFVPEDQRDHAYEDRPLPIGFGQTISQPYIVALMTDLLDLDGDEAALEVGTGSGYQAAVLSPLTAQVHTIEIVPALADRAAATFGRLGYDNVTVRQGDGYYGWEEHAPFDAIVVTAAASHIPPPLVRQLKPGGRMVIPVGAPFFVQHLMLVEKAADGTVTTRLLLPVRFVPLTGGH